MAAWAEAVILSGDQFEYLHHFQTGKTWRQLYFANEVEAVTQFIGSVFYGQDAIIADFAEPFGQDMQHESPYKLHWVELHSLLLSPVCIVFVRKTYFVVTVRFYSLVRNCNPLDIPAKY